MRVPVGVQTRGRNRPLFCSPMTWQPPHAEAEEVVFHASPSGADADAVWQFSQNCSGCG